MDNNKGVILPFFFKLKHALMKLTRREEEILRLLAKGSSKKQVASKLNISTSTVENHCKNIFRKNKINKMTIAVVRYLCDKYDITLLLICILLI